MFNGRKTAIKALVGSHNYNLNDELSDRDYKYFVYPTFDDLYDNKYFSMPSQVSEEMDFDVHDIRKLSNVFWKANINFLEVLHSTELHLLGMPGAVHPDLKTIFDMKTVLSRMNVPYLYHACKGMYFNKRSLLLKGTTGTMPLVKKYGYDTKQALHAYRVLDFTERFLATDFMDFNSAMRYNNEERELMLKIKRGGLSLEDYTKLLDSKYAHFLTLEEEYGKMKPLNSVKETLDELVKSLVRDYL